MMPQPTITFEESLSRVRKLLENADSRKIIGIVGKPGSGKSTLSEFLMSRLPHDLVSLVPMDGYHLSNKILDNLNMGDRKGAPDTFDALGFAALLERITSSREDIYFPMFHREIEESIAAEGSVTSRTKLVLTEGNYLLHNADVWQNVHKHLSESWYVEVDEGIRLKRLVDRHHLYGRNRQEAHEWAHGTDERNACLVETTKGRADFMVLNNSK